MVIAKSMEALVKGSSVIRKMFEEGKEMAAVVGAENVYDFSLGNPSVPAPEAVNKAIYNILEQRESTFVNGYMSNTGFEEVADAVAENLNKRFDTDFTRKSIIMTVGAAGALNVVLRALLNPEDEVICFAPFFGEYRSYVANYGGKLVVIEADTKTFQLNTEVLDSYITEKTKALIINNPNNPTGVIYSAETLDKLQAVLEKAEARVGHPIYVISDEPYRELVYDDNVVPFPSKHLKNCLICYSFSKSLSLPGERIGYLAIPPQIEAFDELQAALAIANRVLGYVNAPSLFQLVIKECLDERPEIEIYDRNRQLLYDNLTRMGFECVKPQGAFYLFVKSPTEDESVFVEEGKKRHILMVPATSFGCPGYVRIAYCVSTEMIQRALPAFEALAKVYFA